MAWQSPSGLATSSWLFALTPAFAGLRRRHGRLAASRRWTCQRRKRRLTIGMLPEGPRALWRPRLPSGRWTAAEQTLWLREATSTTRCAAQVLAFTDRPSRETVASICDPLTQGEGRRHEAVAGGRPVVMLLVGLLALKPQPKPSEARDGKAGGDTLVRRRGSVRAAGRKAPPRGSLVRCATVGQRASGRARQSAPSLRRATDRRRPFDESATTRAKHLGRLPVDGICTATRDRTTTSICLRFMCSRRCTHDQDRTKCVPSRRVCPGEVKCDLHRMSIITKRDGEKS